MLGTENNKLINLLIIYLCRELSFRKGDTIHLVKRLDKNWFEARLHGVSGIVPTNYIEVKDASFYLALVTRSVTCRCLLLNVRYYFICIWIARVSVSG